MKSMFLLLTSFILVSCSSLTKPVNREVAKFNEKKILIIMSSANFIELQEGTENTVSGAGNNRHQTGFFLNEFAIPLKRLIQEGYSFDIATPKGIPATMDKASDSKNYFKNEQEYLEAKKLIASIPQMKKPLIMENLNEYSLQKYSALFIPGGHAPMTDLVSNAYLGNILHHFHVNQKVTALICHAPVALLSAYNRVNKTWIYSNYAMTVFSTAEEKQVEDSGVLGGHVIFYPQSVLTSLGGKVKIAEPWHSNVVVDRELITGQNPMSDDAFANALIAKLK